MSILIKGMEPPISCGECLKIGWNYVFECNLDDVEEGEKLITCPLAPVPPYRRLIDADAFESIKYELPDGQKTFNRGFHSGVQYMQRLIMDAPTVIEAEEVEE